MKSILAVLLIISVLPQAHAAPGDGADFGSQPQDWGQLRRDLDESARKPGPGGEFEARRQAIRERASVKFREADTDGSGALNQSELSRLRPGLAQHFDFIDSNRDGQVTEREIAEAWKKRMQMRRQQSAQPDLNRPQK